MESKGGPELEGSGEEPKADGTQSVVSGISEPVAAGSSYRNRGDSLWWLLIDLILSWF